jgi:hypothetical protein
VSRNIKVSAEVKREPDVRLYVLALVDLARQLQREESADGSADRLASAGRDDEVGEAAE